MHRSRLLLAILMLLLFVCVAATEGATTFIALSYHDVRDDVTHDLDPDRMAVGTGNLIAQFSWLREHGYHPVSLTDILAARDGKRPLPDRAVLLTFDDGYASLYTRVFPILKMFGYPAVAALVGRWLEAAPGQKVAYGDQHIDRERFVTWEQVREMQQSDLVEFASHSHDLHRHVRANPQGNVQPVVVTLQYDPASGTYEDPASHRRLLRRDMQRTVSLLERRTGVRPRCMVWPYGLTNDMAVEEARAAGMPVTLVLGQCINDVRDLTRICRVLIEENPPLEDFVWDLRNFHKVRDPIRVVHVDLDYLFDTNKEQQKRNLDTLLDRIKAMQINTVYLQAFADPDGDGAAEALYFPNRHMPVREDLFNRVAWQLRTRADVDVYAWMPTLAFELRDRKLAEELLIKKWENGAAVPSGDWYRRLSPFHPEARRIIGEIYEDLAAHAFFMGLLFHDDAYLSDFEDAGEAALETYRRHWGLAVDMASIREEGERFVRWSRLKTRALALFTDELTERVKRFRPDIKTARNMYAPAALDPAAQNWLAQSLDVFFEHYDYTALMAMPYMEQARRPDAWLAQLVAAVAGHEDGLARTVFELQSVRWDRNSALEASVLRRHMALLQRKGAVNFGYYPDDFITGRPPLEDIRGAFSLQSYPYGK